MKYLAAKLATHIIGLESQLLTPHFRKSPSDVSSLLAEDFMEIGRSGQIYGRAEVIESLASETSIVILMQDARVRSLSDDVVLLTYRTALKDEDGKPKRHTLRSSIWRLADGSWKMVFHQGTSAQ